MTVISVRSCLSKPTFWVLAGTIMLPMNLFFAFLFWAQARIRRTEGRAPSAQCLNVQVTYTLIFLLPIYLAGWLSSPALGATFPNGALHTMIVGLVLGLIGLTGVITLVFSNSRMFAAEVLRHEFHAPIRVRFVRE